MCDKEFVDVSILLDKVITNIKNNNNEELIFSVEGNEKYKMYHEDDCCECVRIEDICGDLNDLLNSPILLAEEISKRGGGGKDEDESFTWTFYKFATIKGGCTIRWYGSSNGYYSESVDFIKVKDENN